MKRNEDKQKRNLSKKATEIRMKTSSTREANTGVILVAGSGGDKNKKVVDPNQQQSKKIQKQQQQHKMIKNAYPQQQKQPSRGRTLVRDRNKQESFHEKNNTGHRYERQRGLHERHLPTTRDGPQSSWVNNLLSKLAILGDSYVSLLISFLFLLIAIGLSLYVHYLDSTVDHYYYHNSHYTANSSTSRQSSGSSLSTAGSLSPIQKQRQHLDEKTIRMNEMLNQPTVNGEEKVDFEEMAKEYLGSIPNIDEPVIYTISTRGTSSTSTKNPPDTIINLDPDIIRSYHRDGVVAIRGLISNELLNQLDHESALLIEQEQQIHVAREQVRNNPRQQQQFFTVQHGLLFHPPVSPLLSRAKDEKAQTNMGPKPNLPSAFALVALQSAVPMVVAQLLNLTNNSVPSDNTTDSTSSSTRSIQQQPKTLRVVRDIFLAKDTNEYVCGWHVDDIGFWPVTPQSPMGLNVWLALDDMPISNGGGFALAIGSHLAPWKDIAYRATGSSVHYPIDGYRNVSDLFHRRTGSGTCNLQRVVPSIHERMEQTKRIYDVRKGDVIFHTRWLFHRTVPFERKYVQQHQERASNTLTDAKSVGNHQNSLVYRRYSIRYGTGDSVVPPGYGTEWSVLYDDKNGGETLDKICQKDGPWYPEAQYTVEHRNLSNLLVQQQQQNDDGHAKSLRMIHAAFDDLVQNKIPIAQAVAKERRKEMAPYLKNIARQQQQQY